MRHLIFQVIKMSEKIVDVHAHAFDEKIAEKADAEKAKEISNIFDQYIKSLL